jgi:hypothetical protein
LSDSALDEVSRRPDSGKRGYVSPMSYLIVDDRDGSVIAEFDRVVDAVRMIKSAPTLTSAPLRLVVFDDSGGAVARAESWVTVRPL